MIYNMERVDRVIDKILRDLGLNQSEIPYADYVEWIADALEHIGACYQLQEKECSVVICDYQGLLPCDLHKVIRMKNACSISSPSTGFYGGSLVEALNNAGVDYEALPMEQRRIISTYGLQRADVGKATPNKLQHNGNLIGSISGNAFTNNDFDINFNKITTSFQHGIISLQYLAIPIDERGWPLVPDDVSFRDALFWKCAYRLSMRSPGCLPNPQMQSMQYCKDMWDSYCRQARAAAYMPDLAMTERFANNWLRLIPGGEQHRDYATLGKPQNLNFEGRR